MEADLKNKPLVSVCIPVHNAAGYLEAAIRSVLEQTYENIELLMVDDGSSDNSLAIAKNYECDRVKVFHQSNKGASSARNKCLENIKGDYVQFLDADDVLSPDKIAEQVSVLGRHPEHVAVCSTVHFRDGTNYEDCLPSLWEEGFLIPAEPAHFLLNLYGGYGQTGSMVQPNAWLTPVKVARDAGPWNENLTLDDDGEYFCRVILHSAGVLKTKGINYYRKYDFGKPNLSASKTQQHLRSQYDALTLKIKHLTPMGDKEILRKIHSRWLNDLLFRSFPEHPGLVRDIERELSVLPPGDKPYHPFATTAGKFLSYLFGWKIAKRLQSLKQKIN